MHRFKMLLSGLMVALLLVACGPAKSATSSVSVTTEVLNTATPAPVVQAPTATLVPGPTRMVIWLPEPLSPLDNGDAADLLSQQISAFQTSQGNVDVQLRLKTGDGLGGIVATLRAASPVAPGALPDLTLMRRSDVQAAAQAGLIYPLEGSVPSAILGDLHPSALALGQVDGQLYGLPYMLDVQHMAYQPQAAGQPSSRFEDILDANLAFALPVVQTSQINGILLTQYLDAGGTLSTDGLTAIDSQALLHTLQFYEQAIARQLVDPAVLNYASPADYEADLVAGRLDAGLVSSTRYLNLLQAGETLGFGPVPTESGSIVGELDGWLWVMTTSNVDRQALAARFLNWMLDATRQGAYSRTINMIPSQRAALQAWEDNAYLGFVQQLLDNALLPLADNEGGTLARAVQNALVAVLAQESTALAATADLLARLSD